MVMKKKNLEIERYFSQFGDPYKDPGNIMNYSSRDATITNDKGKVIERLENVIFPSFWSQNSSNTVTTKYFRKTDVPETGREIDIRQLTGREGKTISRWGVEQNYFSKKNAKKFEHEIVASLVGQYGSFNSPTHFNLGLDIYGINKEEIGFYINNGKAKKVKNYFEHPQISACFISSPGDSIEEMVDVGAVTSSIIFKGGSGIGGDWSAIRSAGEPVSGGGVASGAKRFMDLQDSTGRVIKSGGKTRRAATMQSISIWHPDAIDIWIDKYKEERKGEILLKEGSPSNWESHTFQDLRSQNVNISTRIDDEFWEAYENNDLYKIRRVVDGKVVKEIPARKLLEIMAFSTHGCGDPGVQNHTIINDWNTCKNSGEIWASNPCSEYMFLNDSACNLASLNLIRFRGVDGEFDTDSFCKAVDLYITAQDIVVSKASYPTAKIAENSHNFRPLGLGYANLGSYIMSLGYAYDSDEARNFASAVTSLMTAEAYLQSTKLAENLGSFNEFEKNREPMLEVIKMHKKASENIPLKNGLEDIIKTANKKWKEVVERGEKYGFRNAQTTLLAPTGTIGFMMDCDTTGGEPVYAQKAYKELSGGGSMTIVNQTIPIGLKKLGYDKEQISKIENYIQENDTIEGCKELNEEHLPIFDCAVSSGEGIRAIFPMGHIKMLGATQPFLSGGISKTINCPRNTSVEEIQDMFYQGRKHGVKAISIYRDGSKSSQPLSTKKESSLEVLSRGERESLPKVRTGITQKVKFLGGPSLFIRTGEYKDGRLGEIFVDSLERGSEINRLLNVNAIQFSEKIQYGVPLKEAIEIFSKAGQSQISGLTDHPFIKTANGVEGFVYDWVKAHYMGDISFLRGENGGFIKPEMRPLPWDLRIYQQAPKLHLIPTVAGQKFYPDSPSLEETITSISGTNYWEDKQDGLDTRKTIEKIKRERIWNGENAESDLGGKLTGKICNDCGNMMINDGSCFKCPHCKTSTGGCGGG